ncbi:hypothetical protein NVP1171O_81 [Vibrio phage 1.171.O._10N.261.52.F12]|nr:hypothetical protein NVP1171O_81 [Vibrio phage 1.171.O._10N.261.52.F12]
MTAIHWFTRDGNDTRLLAVTSEEVLDVCVRYGIYPLQTSRHFIVAGDMTRRALLWRV